MALGAIIPKPVLWEVVCSAVFPSLYPLVGVGPRGWPRLLSCCVSACFLVGVVMLLMICISEASSITVLRVLTMLYLCCFHTLSYLCCDISGCV